MKWFKQLSLVVVNSNLCPTINIFEEKLGNYDLPPVMGLSKSVEGFTAPYRFSEQKVFSVQNSWKMRLTKEEKLLPNYIINNELLSKIEEIEQRQSRKISAKEKKEIKQAVIDELLPKAFVKQSHTEAILNTRNGFLLINQANENKRDEFISKLRDAMGGLEGCLPETKISPSHLMTKWLSQGSAENNFTLDNFCELKNVTDTYSVVKFTKHNLLSKEIKNAVDSNRFVSQLALVWDDKVRFILNHDFTLKNIVFFDLEEANSSLTESDELENEALLAGANQLLMAETLSQLFSELIESMGGLINELS